MSRRRARKGRESAPAQRRKRVTRSSRRGRPGVDALAVILARAGSKGVPGKNAAMVASKPCIVWTIEAAREARRVAHTIVSTDGRELAAIAEREGVQVVKRPRRLAGDRATVDAAARHAVLELEALMQDRFTDREPIVILYGNVPVRPAGLIDAAVELMERTGCDSVQSYVPVGKYHPWWTAVVSEASEGGQVRPWEGRVLNHGVFRRQDLPRAHIPDGGVLVVTRRALMLEIKGVQAGPHAFFGRDRRGIVNAEGSVVDIDAATDLLVADAVLRGRG